ILHALARAPLAIRRLTFAPELVVRDLRRAYRRLLLIVRALDGSALAIPFRAGGRVGEVDDLDRALNAYGSRRQRVEQRAIVRDAHADAPVRAECGEQPRPPLVVEMVRRLVEQERVRLHV